MTDNKKRFMYYWIWFLTTKILILLIIGGKFGLFTKQVSSKQKISIWIILIVIDLVITFWDNLTGFITDMQEGIIRELLFAITSLIIPTILFGSAVLAKLFIDQYVFFTSVIFIINVLGVFLKAKHNQYRRKVLIARGYTRELK